MNELHAKDLHPSQATTQVTGKVITFIMTRKFQPCEDYAMGKKTKQCEEAT